MISALICVSLRWVWHIYNLPCIRALFWLFSVARNVVRSPRICFWGAKYDVYCERFAYLHSVSWRRARLWLELFASTVDKFLSQVYKNVYKTLKPPCSKVNKKATMIYFIGSFEYRVTFLVKGRRFNGHHYRFSFRKLQILISFRSISFRSISFRSISFRKLQ